MEEGLPGPRIGSRERGSLKPGTIWAAAVAAGSAILFGVPGPVHIGAPGARAGIETLVTSLALVSSALLLVSFRQRQERNDLVLVIALAMVGLTDFVFSALPALVGSQLLGLGSATQVTCDALAAVAMAATGFAAANSRARSALRTLGLAGLVAASAVAAASVVDVVAGRTALGGTFSGTGIAAAAAHPTLVTEALVSSTVLFASGVAFFRRPEAGSRPLAGAAFLFAATRLQYLALPAMAPDWVTARDALRLAAYVLLLVTALMRYARTRNDIAAAALVVERERIARDLHDGLAQDLAFIALQGQRLESELGAEHPLTVAARRAVAASRGVIVDLSASTAASTEVALRLVADELAARFGTDIDVRVLEDSKPWGHDDLDPGRREEVVRIVREAIVNAVRHGQAGHVAVALDQIGHQIRLRVADNGRGVRTAKLSAGGHGLQMMRGRAAALGGRLTTRERAEGGVEVEVTFPSDRAARRERTNAARRPAGRFEDQQAAGTRAHVLTSALDRGYRQ
jgi:signal transduction histidine kinase